VARPRIDAAGRFAATAPLPRVKRSDRDLVRYHARLGREKSAALKLWRRVRVDKVAVGPRAVTITGAITGPLSKRLRDRLIEVTRMADCKDGGVVTRVLPNSRGRFRAVIPREEGVAGAVYRLRSKVRRQGGSGSAMTFSLPRAVDFRR
jgi:hypothetical protein